MKRNRDIKRDASMALSGHWGWAILPCLIAGGIALVLATPGILSSASTGALDYVSDPSLIIGILAGSMLTTSISALGNLFGINPLTVGLLNSIKLLFKNTDTNTVSNMFKLGFGKGHYWRNVLGAFLVGLFTFLWTLLFIVPGIIKSYAYAMTPYILDDNPELGPNEARLKSIEIMRGHKGKLFGLDLSFIGWFLLGILSLGIGFIWIEPYFYTARASFYRNLKEELEQKAAPATPAE